MGGVNVLEVISSHNTEKSEEFKNSVLHRTGAAGRATCELCRCENCMNFVLQSVTKSLHFTKTSQLSVIYVSRLRYFCTLDKYISEFTVDKCIGRITPVEMSIFFWTW